MADRISIANSAGLGFAVGIVYTIAVLAFWGVTDGWPCGAEQYFSLVTIMNAGAFALMGAMYAGVYNMAFSAGQFEDVALSGFSALVLFAKYHYVRDESFRPKIHPGRC